MSASARRLSVLLLALAALVAGPVPGASAAEAPDSATAELQEWQLLDLINRDRTAAGLRPLLMQTNLQDYARFHARAQRTQGTIWHDMEEFKTWVPAGWTRIAENVAYNYSVPAMHDAYMASAGHRANILNPDLTHVGIGIMASGTRLYNSQDFMTHASTTLPLATRPGSTPPPADTTAPTAALSAPAAGTTVSGTASVTATASDNVGVTKVEFLVDGVLKGTDTTAPYAHAWDTRTAANAGHDLSVRAYDAAGNRTVSAVRRVTVANPVADTTAPSASGTPTRVTANGYVAFRWTAATDNMKVTGYRVYSGTTQIGTTSGLGFADFTAVTGTTKNYTVRAYDTAGNLGPTSAALTVTV